MAKPTTKESQSLSSSSKEKEEDAAAAATETSHQSTRYNRLVEVIKQSLEASRKAFSTEDAIKECYGDDASMFVEGGGASLSPSSSSSSSSEEFDNNNNNNFLASAIDAMVDQVNNRVMSEMLEFLKKENIQERLDDVETIINDLDREDQVQKQADAEDRQSARDMLQAARLPKDVSPADVVEYQTYLMMEKERDALAEALSKVEADVKALDEKIKQGRGEVEKGVESLDTVGQELQKSAAFAVDKLGGGTN